MIVLYLVRFVVSGLVIRTTPASTRMTRQTLVGALGVALTLSACTTTEATSATSADARGVTASVTVDTAPERTNSATSLSPASTALSSTTTTSEATTLPSTIAPSTTTTAPDPLEGVYNRVCVRQAGSDESLEWIAGTLDGAVDVTSLWAENGFVDGVGAGDLLDVCVTNAVDDITGQPRPSFDDPTVVAAFRANVERQQTKINELFAPFGTASIAVDGVSGPITGQRLCGARLALGLPVSVDDMRPGSDEQATLFAATGLPTPTSSATESERWALIDRTCQMMFIGAGPATVFIFPTSTGSAGFETRYQDRARVFRFDPATDNSGWHNSDEYPVGVDNPLNGNLYKPLYFDLGQAIHGANNVPPTPQSKGCARLSVVDHNALLTWLGLADDTEETWVKDEINLTVKVQGQFVGRLT